MARQDRWSRRKWLSRFFGKRARGSQLDLICFECVGRLDFQFDVGGRDVDASLLFVMQDHPGKRAVAWVLEFLQNFHDVAAFEHVGAFQGLLVKVITGFDDLWAVMALEAK